MYVSEEWEDGAEDAGQQNKSEAKGLRAQLEAALAANKTLKEQVQTFTANQRQTTVKTILAEKKLDAKVAKLIPSDIEPTTAAVEKWLEEFGDLFGVKPEAVNDDGAGDGAAVDVNDEEAMAFLQMSRQLGNVTTGGVAAKGNDMAAKLADPELTHEGLLKLINAAGGGYGMG